MSRPGFASVCSPVSIADKAKSDYFHLGPDLDLNVTVLIFLNTPKKNSLGAFDCRLAHFATVTGL